MPITISCSACGKTLKAPDEAAGKTVNCPNCSTRIVLSPPKPATQEVDHKDDQQPQSRWLADDDHEKRDEPKSRRRPVKSRSGLSKLLDVFSMIVWCMLLATVGGGGLLFISAIKNANSAPQEAAAGAIFSTAFIGLYVVARCIEKISGVIDRMQS